MCLVIKLRRGGRGSFHCMYLLAFLYCGIGTTRDVIMGSRAEGPVPLTHLPIGFSELSRYVHPPSTITPNDYNNDLLVKRHTIPLDFADSSSVDPRLVIPFASVLPAYMFIHCGHWYL